MKRVMQSKMHDPPYQNGNCFRACIASVLEIDIDDIPCFEDVPVPEFWPVVKNWVESQGLEMLFYSVNFYEEDRIPIGEISKAEGLPKGWSILNGKSYRGEDDHSVVALDGLPHHDPHPSKKMVLDVRDYITFHKKVSL